MSYVRFFAMIIASAAMMFALLTLNTWALGHDSINESPGFAVISIGIAVSTVAFLFMWAQFPDQRAEGFVVAAAVLVIATAFFFIESRSFAGEPAQVMILREM